MIDIAILPVFLSAVVALLLTPGPDMLLITSSSLAYGRKVGLSASLGNCTSGIILTLLAAFGISTLLTTHPLAMQAMQLAGVAYLFWLGWGNLRHQAGDSEAQADNGMAGELYKRAVISNLLNPKALLFFMLFLPQFVSTDIGASQLEQMLALGFLLNVMGLSFNILLVVVCNKLAHRLLANPTFVHNQHKIMGWVFIVLGAWMLGMLLT